MGNSTSVGWMAYGAVFAFFKACEGGGKRREKRKGREGEWTE